jgi:hypothetical protein
MLSVKTANRRRAALGVLAADLDRNVRGSIGNLVEGDRISVSVRPDGPGDPERAIVVTIDARSTTAPDLIGRLRSAYNLAGRSPHQHPWTESLVLFVPAHLRRTEDGVPILFSSDVRLAD